LLLALGPVGQILVPFSDFILKSAVRAGKKTILEYDSAVYTARANRSGLTVLERPRLVTLHHPKVQLPKRLEIPTQKLIKPAPTLLSSSVQRRLVVRSPVPMPGFRTPEEFLRELRNRRTAPSGRTTPFNALLSQGLGASGGPLPRRFDSRMLARRGHPGYKELMPLTDVEYPSWVFGRAGVRPLGPRGSRAPQGEFWKWYMSDPKRAVPLLRTARTLATPPSRTSVRQRTRSPQAEERGFWERVADSIADWLD